MLPPPAPYRLPAAPPGLPDARFQADEGSCGALHYYYWRADAEENVDRSYALYLLHGAGHSGASFVRLMSALATSNCVQTVFAPDLRGHGKSWQGKPESLDVDTLVSDVCDFVGATTGPGVRVLIAGHSMGGAIAVKAAHQLLERGILEPLKFGPSQPQSIARLAGVVVLDACEETALQALPASRRFAQRVPPAFPSVAHAVHWAGSSILKSREAAAVSIPPQLYEDEADRLFKWKVDLLSTEQWWKGWFEGMDNVLLGLPCSARVIVLSGIEHAGPNIIRAQMSGKLQLEVVQKAGHIIHEDQAAEVAEIITNLVARLRKAERQFAT